MACRNDSISELRFSSGKPEIIVVIGIPRSGTSMVASIVEALGIFTVKAKGNSISEPGGFFGDRSIKHVDSKNVPEQTIRSWICRWDKWCLKVHGFKTHRFERCLIRNANLRVIQTYRNLDDCIRSVIDKRANENRPTDEYKAKLYLQSRQMLIQRFLKHTMKAGLPTMCVRTSDIITRPVAIIKKIARFINAPNSNVRRAASLVNPDWWHHAS